MRFDDVVFLDIEDVHDIHADVLRLYGGAAGVLNLNMLDSAVQRPRHGHYNALGELAAAYVHGIARNHGYVDANKRTAAGVLMKFLGANGFPVVLAPEWVTIIVNVATGSTTQHELTDMIVARLLGGVDVEIEP